MQAVYHIDVVNISLKNKTNRDIILAKEGAFMSENKLLDLSFEFAVAIVNLADNITAPKSSYMTINSQEQVRQSVRISTKHSTHKAKKISFQS